MTLDVAAPEALRPPAQGVPFARELHRHGDRLALVGPDGTTLTYAELSRRVAATAERLGPVRRLVLLAAGNDIEPLVVYLAALSAGHPVLLTAAGDDARIASLTATYDPDVVATGHDGTWRLAERRPGTRHDLHPDLALLLSTSGSTGSPKLVRLSVENVQANAAAIAAYLDIRDTDRALASLPVHYCYGLSVVNSNLLRGAALLLTSESVVAEGFWELARTWRATSLHGVPYTFDLLAASGFDGGALPSLRYVTQAGGRLEPGRVRAVAELGRRHGWRLFVMYGQTEATARMAYLPPELARSHPDCVGIPIPGGAFDLRGGADEGELIYRGPNVMLGYAESPADLALGRTIHELATGDLARRTPDGLYQVVGRTSRFVKIFGLRIDLGQVERLLAEHGHAAACAGDDTGLALAVTGDAATARELVCARLGLPPDRVAVRQVRELPRLASGKIDYQRVQRPAAGVRDVFGALFGLTDVDDDATFVALGGDSLTYVRASAELGRVLGHLPPDWPSLTVRELERLTPRGSGRVRRLEAVVVLRALAITLVVGTHIGAFRVMGGAHLLLVLAGWSFAWFGLAAGTPGDAGARILRGAARIAVPSVLWLLLRLVTTNDVGWANVLLVSNYTPGPMARGYWFIEVLVQLLLVFGLLFCVPAVRRLEREHPFGVALAVLGAGLTLNLALDGLGQPFDHAMSAHGALWFFALGWLAHRAATRPQRWLVAALALLLVPGYFGDQLRDAIVVGGLLLLLTVRHLPVPAALVRPLAAVAGASLAIYLTHYALYPELAGHLPPAVVVGVCLAAGVAVQALAGRSVRAARTLL
ncbi:AMP-binding protein [Prauserella muralis]|uniref:AMP-binding protein n=1 Tax=Prauserella muralis TaxID=588067 RepID=UPI000DD4D4FE|nr:AMP-binding protein [Prauserella muralis]